MNYLQDKDFLKQLDYSQNKIVYVRIISLTQDELPREEIIGNVTSGSINVDGASAVRRTCSLSLVANKEDSIITDIFWCYNTKFKLQIGLKNDINRNYPDIIWFDMGIYVITSFSKNESPNALNISISGKDKMCLLDGSIGGSLTYTTDFGTIEEVSKITKEDGTIEYQTLKTKLTIKEIIRNAVKEYGQEMAHNILINDLDDHGYELWEYYGDTPLYMFIKNNKVINMTLDGDTIVKVSGSNTPVSSLTKYYSMNTLDPDYNTTATIIDEYQADDEELPSCQVAKIEYGQIAGYHQIPLVYNNDLIINAGDNLVTLLNKLKDMLGNFEFFYDLQGRFVFQKKKDYIQELFSPLGLSTPLPTMYSSQYSYKFEDNKLFTAISTTPNINELKNDFSIWGTKKDANSKDLPLHFRSAIDKKPQKYTTPYDKYEQLSRLVYVTITDRSDINTKQIYQEITKNTKLYYQENNDISNPFVLSTNYDEEVFGDNEPKTHVIYHTIENQGLNPTPGIRQLCKIIKEDTYQIINIENNWYYKNDNGEYILINTLELPLPNLPYYQLPISKNTKFTTTNYDWRELIYQMAIDYLAHNQEDDFLFKLQNVNEQFINGKTGYEQYYTDLLEFWRQLYNPLETEKDKLYAEIHEYEYYENNEEGKQYWNKLIHIDPTKFNFWFDFFDTEGELNKYSIKKIEKDSDGSDKKYIINIGDRTKVLNASQSQVTSIYNLETPTVLFVVKPDEDIEDESAYTTIQIQEDMQTMFYKTMQGLSALNKMNEVIYQSVFTKENLNITSIPIYYLQPNTRIYIEGYGDYTLDKITYNLSYNGTMSLTCNKIIKQFY